MTKMWRRKQYYSQRIGMVKKIKKIKKTTLEKMSFVSLCSRSVGIYDFRVDTFC